jgi:hypothetical protein
MFYNNRDKEELVILFGIAFAITFAWQIFWSIIIPLLQNL